MTEEKPRLERARETLRRTGVDCLLLSVGSDLPYLTGYNAMPLERLTMLVLPVDAEPVLIVPELEAPRVEPGPFEIVPWSETEDPVHLVVQHARRPAVAAIGDQTWSVFLLDLFSHMTETTFIPASTVMRGLRIRKDPGEVEALRAAAHAVDRVLARIPSEVRFEGRTEAQVARDVIDMTLEEGHDAALFWIVASGPNSASPHHEPGGRVIQPGDTVVVDFGGKKDGYCSDVTRTFTVGPPSSRLAEVHAVVREANRVARAAVRPGVPAQEIDRAGRRVIEDSGFGEFFIHRTGHGIGLDGHEHPYLVAGNAEPLEPGMAFSIEPGIYLPGEFGVRIEDICVATADGIDVLNQADRHLIEVE